MKFSSDAEEVYIARDGSNATHKRIKRKTSCDMTALPGPISEFQSCIDCLGGGRTPSVLT